ncbi:MAG: glycoside hydrolase family 2 protein, partial [Verrucomicrobiae bacterium]|nr:glycoside hydrolase family 2 protein [Verrucomicrobiae bacterium]
MLSTLDLNGTWRLRWSDGERGRVEYANRPETDEARYIDAQVPGEVHLDLWRAGLIEDPYVGTNCLKARWVEECYWAYRRWFEAPRITGHAWLVFERLDLVARIFLNGELVGTHQNVFYPCRIEVTGKLKPGRNLLTVHIEGGLFEVMDKPMAGFLRKLDQRLHKGVWLRKPQCQFSWDWSTRLINVGITGNVRLEWTTDPVRLDQLVPLVEVTPDLRTGVVRARLYVEAFRKTRAELIVEVAGRRVAEPVSLGPGMNRVEAVVTVTDPALWWPAGHGPQHLYDVRATLRVRSKEVGTKTARIGFRHVRINQQPHPQKGRYFIVEINGKKIFCKGANLVPADMIFQRCDRARYDTLTDRAREANFNLLRVWGGGQYESDDFYELCDLKGILVWQEFIFACHKYPVVHKEFLDDVVKEATWNIRRLASHPSLIVWCGNNEMEWGAWDWGFDQGAMTYPDYALFHLTLPRLLREEDPTRFYWPSSPYSLDGEHPNADHTGDQHPWSVGFANLD